MLAPCLLPVMLLAAPAPADEMTRLARSSNAFGFDLYRGLGAGPGNRVVSPASVSTALAMAFGGARGGTAVQMARVLRFEGSPEAVMQASGRLAASLQDPSRPIVFRIANRLFGEKSEGFETAYLEATKVAFGAALEPVDFKKAAEKARLLINAWVEEKTEKRIKDLVPPNGVNRETRLVLVNALYFLGDWIEPFTKESTVPRPFSVSAALKKDVPTMHRAGRLRFAARDGLKALELPYKGGSMSMLLLLPDAIDGLPALEGSLTAERLEAIVGSLSPVRVSVALPKFELDPPGSLPLGDVVRRLGMEDAFSPSQADFTAIANPPDPRDRLFLSEVFHKAFVKVDEKGTEAAAATAVVMERAAALPEKLVEFRADHPFLFFIRDNASGLILFMGRVADPSVK
jgi:serine protease inhibitor